MSKKFLSCILCAALTASSLTVLAADVENGQPDVYVNDSKIIFSDQAAQIVNDRTLVPARGVFEAMGNKVEWDDENRTVTVTSSTGVTVATIVIDSDEMNVRTYKSLMEAEDVTVELDVPAQIMNDRTMIPLRAVSEAFNCEVRWDEENYCVNITTGEPTRLEGAIIPTPTPDEDKDTLSLSTDSEKANANEEFSVYIDIDNFLNDCYLSTATITLAYDKSMVEFISAAPLDDANNAFKPYIDGNNPDYYTGCKFLFIVMDENQAKNMSGHAIEVKFRSLTDDPKNISLVNEYIPVSGYGTSLTFNNNEDSYDCSGKDLVIDTTPLTI